MARAQKGRWKEQYFKENFCVLVYFGLVDQLIAEAANLQKLAATVTDAALKLPLQHLADRFTLLTAQASGRESDFNLSAAAMPEDVAAKIPDPRLPHKK